MIASWTPFTNLKNLLELRNSINTFNEALEVDVLALEASVDAKITKTSTGIVFMVGGAVASQELTTAYAKVKLVDTTAINTPNGHITVNHTDATYTFVTAGIYKLVFDGSIEAPNGANVTFNYNVNGASYIATPPVFIGSGAGKPIGVGNHFVINATAGTVLYIEAKADATTTLTPKSCGFTIEKTHY